MANQPTILVKKSDGTSVRMSWDEFNVYRTQNTINKTQPTSVETPNAELPAKEGEVLPATTAPVKEIFVDEAKYVRTVKNKTQNTINKTQRVNDRMQPSFRAHFVVTQWNQADGNTDNRKQIVNDVKVWTKDDSKSLLEDAADEVVKTKSANVLPDKKDDLYDLFVKEIRFPIKDEMRGRLNS
ncbi:hypothetical protein HZA42_01685, partial [Candidatus Peregrinibacteria bacterium]|nr:hypothetical protein [Candidatus Peregrinibacteria bacterium]